MMLLCNIYVIILYMNELYQYIEQITGMPLKVKQLPRQEVEALPLYLKQGYKWKLAEIDGKLWLLAEMTENDQLSVSQVEIHFTRARNILGHPVMAVFQDLEAYNRRRLIEKQIPFIVVNKQVYIPGFLVDLKENFEFKSKVHSKLIPLAQLIVLYYLLHKQEIKELENKTFKELAVFFHTTQMEITRTADNLKALNLINVGTGKEKYIRFITQHKQLWNDIEQRKLFIYPVQKQVYMDHKFFKGLLKSNSTALAEYTDMNPTRQEFYAIDKKVFYKFEEENRREPVNAIDAKYCIEIWKYDPAVLVKNGSYPQDMVDPLSLYLSLLNTKDERVEIALDQLLNKIAW